MTLPSERMLKLMAYVDGELEAPERIEVEGWLSSDVDAVRFVNDLAGLGGLLREGHTSSLDARAIASFDVVDAVMANVTGLSQLETSSSAATVAAEGLKAPPAAVVALDSRRRTNVTVGAVAAALALAASVFLMTRAKEEAPVARSADPTVLVASAEPTDEGVDVDPAESPGETVRVFYLSSEASSTTSVVVWVDESGGT